MRIESKRVSPFVSDEVEGSRSHKRQTRAGRRLCEIQHGPFVVQQIDEKVLAFATFREHSNLVRSAAQAFEQVDGKLGSENDVPQSLVAIQLRDFHTHRTFDARFVEQQIALILRIGVVFWRHKRTWAFLATSWWGQRRGGVGAMKSDREPLSLRSSPRTPHVGEGSGERKASRFASFMCYRIRREMGEGAGLPRPIYSETRHRTLNCHIMATSNDML